MRACLTGLPPTSPRYDATALGGLIAVALVRRCRAFGLIAVAVALTGCVNQAARPVATQSDRLLVEVWVAAVLGLPLLLPVRGSAGRARAVPRRDGA